MDMKNVFCQQMAYYIHIDIDYCNVHVMYVQLMIGSHIYSAEFTLFSFITIIIPRGHHSTRAIDHAPRGMGRARRKCFHSSLT